MIKKIIEFSIYNKGLVILVTFALTVAGYLSLKKIPLDAIPDLSDTQVIVYSKWDVSPDILEDQVTYPIITSLLGVPNVKDIRGISSFDSSFVYVIFEDGTDIYWARSRVLEYLSKITPQLPEDVRVELGPDATGVGWVYQYALVDKTNTMNLAEIKTFQDYFLRYELQSVKGVSEVASFGGFTNQYQVMVNPESLRAYNVTLTKVMDAVSKGNNEQGARVIEYSGTEYMVRAKGYVQSKEDIENIVVGVNNLGVPIYVKNIGRVGFGPELRRGVGDYNGMGDTVGGVIVMRYGENANKVIEDVKAKIEDLKPSFPEGLELKETYNRSELIMASVDTLKSKVILEIAIVSFVIFIFLLHLPSALVPAIALPVSVLISFIFMYRLGMSANIMSLGGIAIAIGAMVDASIVIVENCRKKLERFRGKEDSPEALSTLIIAVEEVARPAFFSLLVIAVAFLPVFMLEGQEGRLFQPLAFTKTVSIATAALIAVTFVPAFIISFIRTRRALEGTSLWAKIYNKVFANAGPIESEHPVSKFLQKAYKPIVQYSVDNSIKVIAIAVLLVIATIPIYFKLGEEFMPTLNEGTVLYMPTTMPGMSITEAEKILIAQDAILMSFPEVKSVHGKAGRADTATDPAPLTMMETVVVLKDKTQWRSVERFYSHWPNIFQLPFKMFVSDKIDYDELITEFDKAMQFPGLTNAWTMPIKGRIDMLTTGIRTPVGIKIKGDDLNEIEQIGIELEAVLSEVDGVRSVFAERVVGGYFLDVNFNREALARHGINIKDAHRVFSAAMGGKNVTTTVDGRERYTVNIRYGRGFRQSKDDIVHILLDSPHGYQIPLGEVAVIEKTQGPGMIRNDNGLLTGYVFVDITDSDIGGFVERAKIIIQDKVVLKPGYSLEYSGQFESIKRVRDKLKVVLPFIVVVIAMLIYFNTGSGIKTMIVLSAVPFSMVGALWLLYFLDYNMSIAVWVGIIALVGIDAETAVYMLLFLDLAYEKRKKEGHMKSLSDLKEAVYEGAVQRVRPKVMTVVTTFIALMPIMLAASSERGADVMKRMAAPMVGGIFTSFIMELVVYPAIYILWRNHNLKQNNKIN